MAFFAAVSAALAFFVIGYIPKSEPSLVVSIWFHAASLASSVPFLAVSASAELLYIPLALIAFHSPHVPVLPLAWTLFKRGAEYVHNPGLHLQQANTIRRVGSDVCVVREC